MKPLTCAATRRRLNAFHDGELPVSEQIAVASHLEWCEHCAAALEDLQSLGSVLRAAQPGRTALPREDEATFPSAVVNRMKAEQTQSWRVRVHQMFEDAHLVYAGAAAAFAAVVCVIVMLGMMRFATSTPRPESLAALIDLLTPGSNQNPVVPRPNVLMPKPLDLAFVTSSEVDGNDEAVFTLAAVVTREGRVANLELLREAGGNAVLGSGEAKVVANLMDAVSRARFEPGSVAGLPVAVNMVWMVAHTTVRGTSDLRGDRMASPPIKEPAVKVAPPMKTVVKKRRVSHEVDAVTIVGRHA